MNMNQFMFMLKKGEFESKAEFLIENGIISEIKITAIKGVKLLSVQELKHFKVFLKYFAEEIVEKWVKYFVYHEEIEFERITKRLK